MTDQDNLNFKEKYAKFKDYYDNNPVAFVEDFNPDIKLLPYQKELLNSIHNNDYKMVSFPNARMNQKRWLENMRLEYMKTMEMNFQVWSSKGIDFYESGVLVRVIKHRGGDN